MKMGIEPLSKWKLFLRVFRYRFSIRVGGYPRGRVIEIYGPELWKDYIDTYCRSSKAGGIAALLMRSTHSTEIMLKN
jgi:hypothetical protein